jgi:hypothetical protein
MQVLSVSEVPYFNVYSLKLCGQYGVSINEKTENQRNNKI